MTHPTESPVSGTTIRMTPEHAEDLLFCLGAFRLAFQLAEKQQIDGDPLTEVRRATLEGSLSEIAANIRSQLPGGTHALIPREELEWLLRSCIILRDKPHLGITLPHDMAGKVAGWLSGSRSISDTEAAREDTKKVPGPPAPPVPPFPKPVA